MKQEFVTLPREIVEKTLKALQYPHIKGGFADCYRAENELHAALEHADHMGQKDWKLVPVEPTQEMIDSVVHLGPDVCFIYEEMLNAAPELPQITDRKIMLDTMRDLIEGMSVSMDVSTCEYDAGHRYFGTVTEVMDAPEDKHGVTLLVQDAEPNFAPQQVKHELTDEEIEQLWYPSSSIAESGKRRVAFGRAVLERAFGKLQKGSEV